MNKGNILIWVLVAVVLAGGGIYFYQQNLKKEKPTMEETAIKDKEMMKDGEKMSDDKMMEDDAMMKAGYKGKVLAGKISPYLEFNQADYEKAQKEGKIVFLDFYANWCPICRAEAPEIHSGFDSLTTDKIVGFRVNFKDSDTDENEKKLAEKYEIPYQHTKVILKGGQQVLKSGDQWDKETFTNEINKAL